MSGYLEARDVVFSLQGLSTYWRKFAKNPSIWKHLDKVKKLKISERLKILQCLVERRSKGKLYVAVDRIT